MTPSVYPIWILKVEIERRYIDIGLSSTFRIRIKTESETLESVPRKLPSFVLRVLLRIETHVFFSTT